MLSLNNRVRILALVIALAMLAGAMAGCKATINNPVVAKVGDVDITYSEFYSQYNTYSSYYSYGFITLEEGASENEQLKEMTFNSLINAAIPVAMAHSMKITLDENELAAVAETVQTTIDSYLANYKSYIDQSITDEDAIYDAEMEVLLEALAASDITYEEFLADITASATDSALAQKLEDQVIADADVTEEEVEAWYKTTLLDEEAAYAEDPAAYYADVQSYNSYGGVRPLVAPEGYGYYKHILIANAAEGETKDLDLIATEILKRIADGEDFDALIEEYNEDPGMSNPTYANGYLVSEANAASYYEEFSAAALALENVGDISEPVATTAGLHIIKKVGVVDTTPVPLEDVYDEIYEYLLETEQSELLNAATEEWREQLTIKRYDARVKYIGQQ